ncbi:hypothetical protein COY51_05450 [Candidatus Desantisbacteria bacterium CG_4_10_14_0_8_um_filter_39_17]|uniref:Uncharacterized protein n=1 Tax=Candidatus Desantisbacteria bacterium CG_4_10_14_0_8_um_filter_39_17 TaxID=1974542 RepID=A0A2H9PAE6_9BACT|nr:MAG: hypothetical protein COY51_05450 [Candidatus Desantisbacteria bacterium CG_4_10_14_0_8_um_filter_39_17]
MSDRQKSVFGNQKLDNNNIEKIAWQKFPIKKRLEEALSWGKEMEWLHQKLYGKIIKIQKIKKDLENLK